jgi:BMFP domain-containing protein YqiC
MFLTGPDWQSFSARTRHASRGLEHRMEIIKARLRTAADARDDPREAC